MSLRRRAALLTGAVMVTVVLVVLVLARLVTADALVATIDADLRELADIAERALGADGMRGADGMGGADGMRGPGRGGSLAELRDLERRRGGQDPARRGPGMPTVDGPVQLLTASGEVVAGAAAPALPVSGAAVDLARTGASGADTPLFEDVEVEGASLRVLTQPLPGGGAVQLGRSLVEVETTLATLTLRLLGIGGALVAAAAGLAVAVATRITQPVAELTATAEHVARTQQLEVRVAPAGDDELARLGRAFDDMLARLAQARAAQTQLIADASHELRTPLTSLRTNIELLRSGVRLSEQDHRELLADLGDQLARFGALVDGLVELARGEAPLTTTEEVPLDTLVDEVVDGARRDHPAAQITSIGVDGTAVLVPGDRTRLTRALRNLVDNAVLHGGGEVEVLLEADHDTVRIAVRDHGPGFGPRERERVLERFYRGEDARTRPGSGLGLAIVAQAARAHDGTIEVADADDGGAVVTLALPRVPGGPHAHR